MLKPHDFTLDSSFSKLGTKEGWTSLHRDEI